ncbi:MAG: Glu-tRNA(Gln) amidotransferase subunit GatD [Nanoarchaeota archaeon]|nr:Glu-tRNA(Gln) amidotransferase subunit GatD [Nanoarchaeota archaeon]MBU1050927.1 Glu-tRNA(Gln) amidotransferase subunit GatD [Nanoarchaeota archaeon]
MAELNFQPGDYVCLRLAKEEIEGRVLESSDSSIVLLKLKTGYNIGIPRENILAGRALKRFKLEEEGVTLTPPTLKEGKKNIGLIVTGGTIASKLDPRTGGVAPLTEIGEFAKFYPELFKIVNVERIEVPFMIASESMTSEHWIKIAQACEKMLNDSLISGVIVTHGTDFLHYTSAALSFFLKNLNKPVVLTYSQRSIDRASSDANLNLQCAAQMVIYDCAEVMLVGHASNDDDFCYAMPGTKVRKLHSSRRDAFKVVNDRPIAKVWKDKVKFLREYKPRNNEKVELDIGFNDKVALIKFYPGQDPSILDFYALKYKGIVVEASGLGHLPVSEAQHNWIPKLKKYIREGLVVCAAAQTVFGRLDPYVYSNGRELLDAGVIFLEDMLAETALVKLGWILGHHGWKGKAKEKMLENVVGELNERLGVGFLDNNNS